MKEVPRQWLLGSTAGDLCLDSRVAGLPIPTREDGSEGGLTGHVEEEWQWDCDLVHPMRHGQGVRNPLIRRHTFFGHFAVQAVSPRTRHRDLGSVTEKVEGRWT